MKTNLIVNESEDGLPTYSQAMDHAASASAAENPPDYPDEIAASQTYWWDEGNEGEGALGSSDHSQPPPRFSAVVASQSH